MKQTLMVPFGKKIKIKDFDPDYTDGYKDPKKAKEELSKLNDEMSDLQNLLYAESKHALLIVLQAMDAGGKDGTIKNVLSGVNPQGCYVTSFKTPTPVELAHDFLWRIHAAVPAKGYIGIFNRSHYEDVLFGRVHKVVPKEVWKARFEQINNFEKNLAENGTIILKFFLHISKKEQEERFKQRVTDPLRNWKFSPDDFKEREYWDDYMEAYEDIFTRCNADWAPWYVIPANKKWYRNLVIAQVIVDTLKELKMKYPPPKWG